MMLNHWNVAWRVRSWVVRGLSILKNFFWCILCSITCCHLLHIWNRFTSLGCKEALAHSALYLSCVSCWCLHLVRLHHWWISGTFMIRATSSSEALWISILSLKFLLAVLDAVFILFLWNNCWLLEMFWCFSYHNICLVWLIADYMAYIIQDVGEWREVWDSIDVNRKFFNWFFSWGNLIIGCNVLLLPCKTSMQLLLRVSSCKLRRFNDQRGQKILINNLKLPLLSLFLRLKWRFIVLDSFISILYVSLLSFKIHGAPNISSWLVIFFQSCLWLLCLPKLRCCLCLCHRIKLTFFFQ